MVGRAFPLRAREALGKDKSMTTDEGCGLCRATAPACNENPPAGYNQAAMHGHTPAPTLAQRLSVLSPFGVGHTKPRHFTGMAQVAWQNRDNLPYAWKVLSRGVCDGCALGVAGFHDWTIDGVHLCLPRLNLLRLNTMPAMAVEPLNDVRLGSPLRAM